jgi:hypothetical protein
MALRIIIFVSSTILFIIWLKFPLFVFNDNYLFTCSTPINFYTFLTINLLFKSSIFIEMKFTVRGLPLLFIMENISIPIQIFDIRGKGLLGVSSC